MNGIIKSALRISSLKNILNPIRLTVTAGDIVVGTAKRQFTRTLWHMCSPRNEEGQVGSWKLKNPSNACSCGCGIHRMHTKGEKELVEFLSEEIATERKAQKIKTIPSELDGFKVKLEGSEVTLTKKSGDETVEVNFNVNHTVDTDAEAEVETNPNMDKPDFAELKSKPSFEIDINKGNKTLSFTCSFASGGAQQSEEGYNDVFTIDEVTIYEGEWNEKTYAVAGEVLDGYLYDLLMNLLEEKGVSNEFVDKLSEFSTVYEHTSYIALLESLKRFSSGK